MAKSLEHLNVGEKIARRNPYRYAYVTPCVDHEIHTITRKTPTQLITDRGIRVRHDGRLVGGSSYFDIFEVATPEMIAENEKQLAARERYRKAVASVDDLINRPLHHLKLTTEQLERLAEAWAEVKAMAPAADSSKN